MVLEYGRGSSYGSDLSLQVQIKPSAEIRTDEILIFPTRRFYPFLFFFFEGCVVVFCIVG